MRRAVFLSGALYLLCLISIGSSAHAQSTQQLIESIQARAAKIKASESQADTQASSPAAVSASPQSSASQSLVDPEGGKRATRSDVAHRESKNEPKKKKRRRHVAADVGTDVGIPVPTHAPDRAPASSSVIQVPEDHAAVSARRDSQVDAPVESGAEAGGESLFGSWGGLRPKLSSSGIDLNLVYKYDFNRVVSGGVERRSESLNHIDFKTSVDFEKLMGAKGLSGFVYGLANWGGDPSANVGDNQVSDNLEAADNTGRVYELWIQQLLFEDKVSVLAGIHDLNSEFYVTDSSSLFLNSSFGVARELSQTGVNGPSIFPVTSPALRLRLEPTKSVYFQTAVFNAVAGDPSHPTGTHWRLSADDGVLQISEAAYLRGADGKALSAKYGIGYWAYNKPSELNDLDGNALGITGVSSGTYFIADQSLASYAAVFARVGFATASVNAVESNYAAGVVLKDVVPGRRDDAIGVAYTQVNAGRQLRDASSGTVNAAESSLEISYRAPILRGITVQPDFQFVRNPSFSSDTPSASVLTVRLEACF